MKKHLAKLNAKNLNMSGAGSAGHGALTPHDLAACLAFCSDPLASSLLRLKYADHKQEFKRVADGLEQRIRALAEQKKWKAKADETWSKLCSGAIIEFCYSRCSFEFPGLARHGIHGCSGRGELMNERLVLVTCPACGGTGIAARPDQQRARVLGINRKNFPLWEERWEAALGELRFIESVGAREASERMG